MTSLSVRLPVRRPRAEMRTGLAALSDGHPPFLSVYLDVTPGERRSTAERRLRDAAGRREGVTDLQIETAVLGLTDLSDEDALYAALVDASGTIVRAGYPDPPAHELIDLAPLPRMGPFLAAEQTLHHHVTALIEEDTLTLTVVPRHGEPTHQVMSHDGIGTTADRIEAFARDSRTSLVVICGPQAVVDAVSPAVETALGIETTVAPVHTDQRVDASAITRAVANHGAEKTVGLLRLWRFHQSHGEAVDGVVDCLEAIAANHVSLVLIHDDPDDQRWGWFGPRAERVAHDLDHASPIGTDEALQRARLVDIVLRSALLSGCGVHLVPNVGTTLEGGIGVILDQRASAEDLASLLER